MLTSPGWFSQYSSNAQLQRSIIESILRAKKLDPFAPVTLIVDSPLQGLLLRRQIAQSFAKEQVAAIANLHVQTPLEFIERLSAISGNEVFPQPSTSVIEATIYALMENDVSSNSLQSMPTANAIAKIYKKLELIPEEKLQALLESPNATSTQQTVFSLIQKARKSLQFPPLASLAEDLLSSTSPYSTREIAKIGQLHSLVSALPELLQKVFQKLVDHGVQIVHHVPYLGETEHPFSIENSTYISAPDPFTEASIAIRGAMQDLKSVPANKIAIVYADEAEYLNQLVGQLDEIGISWHGKGKTFGQESVLVRTLTLILEALSERNASTSGLDRPKLMRLLQNGHIVIDGIEIEVDSVRKLIRNNSLFGDSIYWLEIIDSEISDRDSAYNSKAIEHLKHLLAFLDIQLSQIASSDSWAELGERLVSFLKKFHQNLDVLLPNSVEERAWSAIKDLLQMEIAKLDEIEMSTDGHLKFNASPKQLLRFVKKNLFDRRQRHGNLSTGIYVGDLNGTEFVTFDVVYILGATEGILPSAIKPDTFLPAALLVEVAEQQLSMISADNQNYMQLLKAHCLTESAVALTVLRPRGGTAAKVDNEPSRFLSPELVGSADPAKSILISSFGTSFSVTLRGNQLLPVRNADLTYLARMQNPVDDVKFERSMNAWRDPSFDEYFGNLSKLASLGPIWTPESSFNLSSTRIDSYIKCHYQFFSNTVLGFHENDVSDQLTDFSANSFGIFFHKLMEDFVNDLKTRGQLPGENQGFSPGQTKYFMENYLKQRLRQFKSTGRDGWERNLTFHIEALLSTLPEFFRNEIIFLRMNPALAISEAEKSFGKKGDDITLVINDLDGTPFSLSGQIDRVDIAADGSAIGIMDFKTGKRSKQQKKLGIGAKRQSTNVWTLQDVIYREAARQIAPQATDIRVNFCFITEHDDQMFLNAPYSKDPNNLLPKILKMIKESGVSGEYMPQGTRKTTYDHSYCKTCSYLGDASEIVKEKYKAATGSQDGQSND